MVPSTRHTAHCPQRPMLLLPPPLYHLLQVHFCLHRLSHQSLSSSYLMQRRSFKHQATQYLLMNIRRVTVPLAHRRSATGQTQILPLMALDTATIHSLTSTVRPDSLTELPLPLTMHFMAVLPRDLLHDLRLTVQVSIHCNPAITVLSVVAVLVWRMA